MIKRYRDQRGATSHTLTIGRWQWDTGDWSLSLRDLLSHQCITHRTLFAFRCGLCRRFTAGCKDHHFCGLCEHCRACAEEQDESDE
jgi:hypothetical protein